MRECELTYSELEAIIESFAAARICVIGDMCLDMYLYADMKKSTLSRETPHYPLPVVRESFSPGGGGNVCNNVKALGAQLFPLSVIGTDWRGYLLKKAFAEQGIPSSGLIESKAFITPAYLKPMRMGISDVIYEDPRLDFENRIPLPAEDEAALLSRLKQLAGTVDVIAVADQTENGVITRAVLDLLAEIAQRIPVIIDSRSKLALYLNKGFLLKPNEVEAAAVLRAAPIKKDDPPETYTELGKRLAEANRAPVIMTMGDKGAMWCDGCGCETVATVAAEPPVDIVGCGDTFLSALCCCLASGLRGRKALALANLASAVSVKKIGTTGTATAREILEKRKELYR